MGVRLVHHLAFSRTRNPQQKVYKTFGNAFSQLSNEKKTHRVEYTIICKQSVTNTHLAINKFQLRDFNAHPYNMGSLSYNVLTDIVEFFDKQNNSLQN